jgi:sRNA-binding carbon storage regulator CsrA
MTPCKEADNHHPRKDSHTMLVLKRNVHQYVLLKVPGPINDYLIKVYLKEVCSGNSAKLGIEAPGIVSVVREELLDGACGEGGNGAQEPEQHHRAADAVAGASASVSAAVPEYRRADVRGEVTGIEIDPT